jgi:hypothetical protein
LKACRVIAFPLLLAATVAVSLTAESRDLDRALIAELSKRPAAEASDIYKFIHQTIFGPGHLIQDVEAAREYLDRELAGLGPTRSGEVLREDLGDGLVRVNLRPFRDAKGSVEDLLRAMVLTAQATSGDGKRMDTRLAAACRLLELRGKAGLAEELQSLAWLQAGKGHPALHHSKAYQLAYRPAYRVVHLQFFGQAPK